MSPPRRGSPELRIHFAIVKAEIDRWLHDPAAMPDLDRLRAYWRGEEVAVPEGPEGGAEERPS